MNQRIHDAWVGEPGTYDLAALIERGRRLHSEAVFAACASLLRPFKGASAGKAKGFAAGERKPTSR